MERESTKLNLCEKRVNQKNLKAISYVFLGARTSARRQLNVVEIKPAFLYRYRDGINFRKLLCPAYNHNSGANTFDFDGGLVIKCVSLLAIFFRIFIAENVKTAEYLLMKMKY